MGPGALTTVLSALRLATHPDLLIGLEVSDDAAVYRISADLALVQTVDFFPPIVDDPYTYGAIAAANALSDIYAMGAQPTLALAIAAFPENLPLAVIQAILQGGADKVAEAGAVIAGGHTVVDPEPKYGLCVTGLIHPAKVIAKAHAQAGDLILLTKALGTGIITTAAKQNKISDDQHYRAAIQSMLTLNKQAAELAQQVEVHSATDITGFGLLGHAAEIARNSGVGLQIALGTLPLLPGALQYAAAGITPGGLSRNRQFLEQDGYLTYTHVLDDARLPLLFDPQTSGGLLIIVPPSAATVLRELYATHQVPCWQIGKVVPNGGIEIIS